MSKPTKTFQGKKALDIIKIGVNEIYGAVRLTIGPEAGTTLMYRTYNRGPRNVDDGYYTAEVIEPRDPAIKLASDFFKEGIKKTNQRVGDGTSATAVIGGVLFNESYDRMHAKASGWSGKKVTGSFQGSPMLLKREILSEAKLIKEEILKASKPVKSLADLEKVAMISLGDNEEIAKIVAKMAWELGVDNSIDVVEGYKGEVETETTKGFRFPAKVCGKAFVNKPERYEMVIEDCPVIITDYKMDNSGSIGMLIEKMRMTKFAIVAPDFSNDVLIKMVLSQKNGVSIIPVKAPSLRTDQFKDLAVYSGGNFISKDTGTVFEMVTTQDLGFFGKLIVKDTEAREDAIMTGGKGEKSEAVRKRIKELEGQKENESRENFKKLLERRIASMASAVGIIRVGSPTDAETLPLKMKIEDVVYACKAALRGGYVKGGGLCLWEIAKKLPKDHILKEALSAPYNQIQENAGRVLEIGKDVIDPTEAIYYAVEHATSVVSSLITVKNLIPEYEDVQPGEGYMAIAYALNVLAVNDKIHKGQITENQREIEMDAMGGLTVQDKVDLDNG